MFVGIHILERTRRILEIFTIVFLFHNLFRFDRLQRLSGRRGQCPADLRSRLVLLSPIDPGAALVASGGRLKRGRRVVVVVSVGW